MPEVLAESVWAPRPGLLKRERTRLQLVQAAIRVFSMRGYGDATMQEIATTASMTTGTVYNHFKTKEEVARAVALLLAHTLCRRITDSQQGVAEGSQRMAIGIQRYIWLAGQSPEWARMMLEVSAAAPEMLLEIRDYVLADLRLGVKQKAFRVPGETAAMDLINGTVQQAMRTVSLGGVPALHGREVASCVLRGLGMEWAEAKRVAQRALPPFPPMIPSTDAVTAARAKAAAPAKKAKRAAA
ncbi:TetR/AcrR family transcriptional regulator [Variovorax sp. J22R115]|uniref:TetR/AcrR family transcriptional regulator n=1 Tax=Variovorax sp. J22R115 TaxID=3053509 RepID=UPI002578B6F9|nr:TetR/AcrR family transcriptional regulator [Variovorax sp. J22R115]MDM0052676.1 TetR/AcrR family transcriptional regulator [Variovorax sp. J22R115]